MESCRLVQIFALLFQLVLTAAHEYLGCGSPELDTAAAASISCTLGAPIFYAECSSILSGTIMEKAKKCSAHCSAYVGYKAFSVQESSATCLCLKNVPAITSLSSGTPVGDCLDSDVVFSIQEQLRPSFLIRLERSDQRALTVGMGATGLQLLGFQPRSETSWRHNFFLARCSLPDGNACAAQASAWTGAEKIKSGDIVALVSQDQGASYSCGDTICSEVAFPPSDISSMVRISKDSLDGIAMTGTTINFGDDVSFHSLQANANVICDKLRCGVNSSYIFPINDGKFKVTKSQEDNFVSPNAMIKMMQGGRVATPQGMRSDSTGLAANWFLSKCVRKSNSSMSCATDYNAMNIGDKNIWGGLESIKSGDVVSWVSQHRGLSQSLNCVDDDIPCFPLHHPPLPGFQGAYFTIVKVVGDDPAAIGTPISFGDVVYFYSMGQLEWDELRRMDCDDNHCKVTNFSASSRTTFHLIEAAKDTCAQYTCPSSYSTHLPHADSTLLTDGNCCQLEVVDDSDGDSGVMVILGATAGAGCCICAIGVAVQIARRRKENNANAIKEIYLVQHADLEKNAQTKVGDAKPFSKSDLRASARDDVIVEGTVLESHTPKYTKECSWRPKASLQDAGAPTPSLQKADEDSDEGADEDLPRSDRRPGRIRTSGADEDLPPVPPPYVPTLHNRLAKFWMGSNTQGTPPPPTRPPPLASSGKDDTIVEEIALESHTPECSWSVKPNLQDAGSTTPIFQLDEDIDEGADEDLPERTSEGMLPTLPPYSGSSLVWGTHEGRLPYLPALPAPLKLLVEDLAESRSEDVPPLLEPYANPPMVPTPPKLATFAGAASFITRSMHWLRVANPERLTNSDDAHACTYSRDHVNVCPRSDIIVDNEQDAKNGKTLLVPGVHMAVNSSMANYASSPEDDISWPNSVP